MSVKNVVLENMVFTATHGIDITEGSGIQLKNIQLITRETNPVATIHNSQNITIENLVYPKKSEVLLSVGGEKSKAIVLSKTDVTKASSKAEFNYGATATTLVFKP